jgi:hypothetical protein
VDHNDDKKNPYRGTIVTLKKIKKNLVAPAQRKVFFLIREEILR